MISWRHPNRRSPRIGAKGEGDIGEIDLIHRKGAKGGTKMNELISIEEAIVQGIKRLRNPIWCAQEDHIEIDIVNNVVCFWVKFYSPMNMKLHGRDPVDIPVFSLDFMVKEWVPYTGITPDL